jgi:hypothetical protein
MRVLPLTTVTLAYSIITLSGCIGSVESAGDAGAGGTGSVTSTGGASGKGSGPGAGGRGATGKGGTGAAGKGGSAGAGASGTGGSTGGSSGGGGEPPVVVGVPLSGQPVYAHWVRLTHSQWEASVSDLLKLPAAPGLSTSFESDPPNGMFSNNERALEVTNNLWGDYQRAAETLANQVAQDATARARIAPGTDSAGFIRSFGRRAYRRDLTPGEQSKYEALFASGATAYETTDAFANGVEIVVTAMLQSPHFVYRSELGDDGAPLSGYEVASKLSFLLRNTMPSDALLDAAGRGDLDTTDGITAAAQEMLAAGDAKAVASTFHAQLFGLTRYNLIEKNRTLFPEYSEAVNPAIQEAEALFFDRIFTQGLGFRDILTSTVGFVNSTLAPFYDVNVTGSAFQEVDLGAQRPGFTTRLGFLAYNGTLRDSDPIHRGVDVINRLLCADLVPPADLEIPPLPTPEPGQTTRERVTEHTQAGVCAGCHEATINPPGFAFENFDAMGQLRTMDAGKPVDTTGEFEWPEGVQTFSGAAEFVAQMAESSLPHACFAKHLVEFSLARDVRDRDVEIVTRIQELSLAGGSSEKQAILAIVQDPSFTVRAAGAE